MPLRFLLEFTLLFIGNNFIETFYFHVRFAEVFDLLNGLTFVENSFFTEIQKIIFIRL